MGRVEEGAGWGGGQGPQGSALAWVWEALGSQSQEKRETRSADPPPFGRARTLGLLGETGTMGECLCGFEGPRVRLWLRRILKELRKGVLSLPLCDPLETGFWRRKAGG